MCICIVILFAVVVSDPPVPIPDLPSNLYDGLKCFVGIDSKTCAPGQDDGECYPDDCNPQGPLFVTFYLVFNQLYNLLILLLIKYGSSNLLWLALTLMVPLGNVTFTLPFVPENQPLQATDIIGLILICGGLGCYRFAAGMYEKYYGKSLNPSDLSASDLRNDKSILSPFLEEEEKTLDCLEKKRSEAFFWGGGRRKEGRGEGGVDIILGAKGSVGVSMLWATLPWRSK